MAGELRLAMVAAAQAGIKRAKRAGLLRYAAGRIGRGRCEAQERQRQDGQRPRYIGDDVPDDRQAQTLSERFYRPGGRRAIENCASGAEAWAHARQPDGTRAGSSCPSGMRRRQSR